MISLKETHLYQDILKELKYPFGNVYIFDGYVVSEIEEGISFNWEQHAKFIIEDVTSFLNKEIDDLIYISNRVNSYSVMAQDWVKFFKKGYSLKGYCVISDRKAGILGFMIENLFFKNKIKNFNCLYSTINWVEQGLSEVA